MVSTGASSGHFNQEDINKPLWNYVTKYEKIGDGGGNVSWQCSFCDKVVTSSYTRVRAHLLRLKGQGIKACPNVTMDDISEMQKLEEAAKLRLNKSPNLPERLALLPPNVSFGGISTFVQGGDESKKRKTSPSSTGSRNENLTEATNNAAAHEQVNIEIGKMFYSAGLPYQLARNPYFRSSFTLAANSSIQDYTPPTYKMLMTTLLQKEKARIHRLLEPIKGRWKENGVTIVSDGWSDLKRRPVVNFFAVTDGLPMFLKFVDCSSEIIDKFFIANSIKEVINEVGHENVVQVITDNALNCKDVGELIEAQFPNISWTPCVVHTLDLALEIICDVKKVEDNQVINKECRWVSNIIGDVMQIKHYIMNHSLKIAILKEFPTLKYLSLANTRFAWVVVMLRRFRLIKHGLQSMVISEKWSCYREEDVEKAKFVRKAVLDDVWWDSVDYILAFTAPIYDMLRACDTDKPSLHLVCSMFNTMIQKVKMEIYKHERKRQNESSTFYDFVYQTLFDLWNKNSTPLHCLAHSLIPRYYTDAWLKEDSNHVPPYKDLKVSPERMKCFKKCFPNSDERIEFSIEYVKFSIRAGDYGDQDSIHDRYTLDPKDWWLLYGTFTPMLQRVALKLLGHPSSSSCCEKNWSTYSFIHSQTRDKMMTSKRMQDLVFVHNNLRLLSRRMPEYSQGETKMWDVGGDAFDLFEDVGVLGIANLSLDEPEFEAEFIKEEVNLGDYAVFFLLFISVLVVYWGHLLFFE